MSSALAAPICCKFHKLKSQINKFPKFQGVIKLVI